MVDIFGRDVKDLLTGKIKVLKALAR